MRAPHRIAELLAAVEAETPYGGRSVSYEPLGWIWLTTNPRTQATRAEGEAGVTIETLTAETRVDPRLATGRVARLSGTDWRIAAVDPLANGRARLKLERSR